MTEDKNLVTTNQSLPSILEDVDYQGFKNVDPLKHLKRPFLKLAQRGTEQAQEDNSAYIPGLKPNMFFNTATNSVFGSTFRFIIIDVFYNYVMYGPNGLGDFRGSITEDEFDKVKNTLSKNEKENWVDSNNITYNYTINLIGILPDFPEEGVVIYPLSSSGVTPGRNWVTECYHKEYKGKYRIPYIHVWEVNTMKRNKDGNTWYQIGDKKILCVKYKGIVTNDIAVNVKKALEIAKVYMNTKDNIDYSDINTDGEMRTITPDANIDSADM